MCLIYIYIYIYSTINKVRSNKNQSDQQTKHKKFLVETEGGKREQGPEILQYKSLIGMVVGYKVHTYRNLANRLYY